jgi:hypothetical protein
MSHPAADIEPERQAKLAERLNQAMAERVTMRDRAQVARFFDGLELVELELVLVPEWQPGSEAEAQRPGRAVGRRRPQDLSATKSIDISAGPGGTARGAS